MNIERRKVLAIGAGCVVALPFASLRAWASESDEAISAFTGGASIAAGTFEITAPEIAENGNSVPISVSAPGATEIAVFATGNPTPKIVTFRFGALSGSSAGSTRVRLAQTQEVIAVAKLADGSFQQASATVKVTIGGCGG